MHLTQALKEHAKDKGSLVLLWEIRNQKNTPVPYVFLCICKHKINRGQDQLLWMWKLHWKEENKVRFSCLTSGIPQWSGTSFSRKHLTFWKKKKLMVSKNWGDSALLSAILQCWQGAPLQVSETLDLTLTSILLISRCSKK